MNIPCTYSLFFAACLTLIFSDVANSQQFSPPRSIPAAFTNDAGSPEATYPVASNSFRQSQRFKSSQPNSAPKIRSISTSMTGFGVPFKISDDEGRFIEVQLYVSKDRGKSWQFHDRKSPSDTEFPFYSKGDGEYWFALKTLDRDRKLHPDGNAQPELKVIVDTRRPKLEFAVKSDAAGRIVCKWRAQDLQIDPKTLRISYRPTNQPNAAWTAIEYRPIQTSPDAMLVTDQLAWWPDSNSREITVRLQVADLAGNESSDQRSILVPQLAMRTSNVGTARPQPQCANGTCKLPGPDQRPGPPAMLARAFGGSAGQKTYVGSPPEFAAPPKPIPSRDSVTAKQASVSLDPNPQTQNRIPKLAHNEKPKSVEWGSKPIPIRGLQHETVNSTQGQGSGFKQASGFKQKTTGPVSPNQIVGSGANRSGYTQNDFTAPNHPTHRQTSGANQLAPITPRQDLNTDTPRHAPLESTIAHPASGNNRVPSNLLKAPNRQPVPDLSRKLANVDVQAINSKKFLLNYNVDSVDPSGVGKVVLWLTRDGGETWKSWANDNDTVSPFPVQMEQDGTFGFRVVIHSNDGLAGKSPERGDEADMWIRIDTEAPQAKIISVPYGTGNEAGRLVINWQATDEKLSSKPIKLAYSTNPQGPWTTIEEGVRNTGRYLWKVGRNIPEQLYLRLEVRDAAGNKTVQQLTRPIDVSGLVPRGRINGVQPIVTQ